jgi:hypothetical protein
MNLNDLISKLRIIESNEVAPVHTDGPAEEEGIEIIGGPMGGMMGGMGHSEPPKQQDSVSMNVSLNGAGAQGVRDLMNILHNIEQGVDHTDHSDEHDHNEPIMGDMVDAMADEQMQFQPEQGLEEVQDDDGQTWGNSAYGDSGHHVHGIDSITMKGNDLASKGGHEPHKRQGGGNPYNESLVNRLSQMYQQIKEGQVGHDYQTGEPLKQGPDGKWRNSKGEVRDQWSGGPMLAPDKPKYRGLVAPQKEAYNPNSVAATHARDLKAHHRAELKKKAEAGDERAKAMLKHAEDRDEARRQEFNDRMER